MRYDYGAISLTPSEEAELLSELSNSTSTKYKIATPQVFFSFINTSTLLLFYTSISSLCHFYLFSILMVSFDRSSLINLATVFLLINGWIAFIFGYGGTLRKSIPMMRFYTLYECFNLMAFAFVITLGYYYLLLNNELLDERLCTMIHGYFKMSYCMKNMTTIKTIVLMISLAGSFAQTWVLFQFKRYIVYLETLSSIELLEEDEDEQEELRRRFSKFKAANSPKIYV